MADVYTRSIDLPDPEKDAKASIPSIFDIVNSDIEEQDSIQTTIAEAPETESEIENIIASTESDEPTYDDLVEAADWFGGTIDDFYSNDPNPFDLDFQASLMTVASQLAYALDTNQNLGDFFLGVGKGLLYQGAQQAGIMQIWNNLEFIKNEIAMLGQFNISFQSVQGGDLFQVFDGALNNAELLINHMDNIINNVDGVITYVTEKLPQQIERVYDYIQEKFQQVDQFITKISNMDFSNLFDSLPGEIMNGLMELPIIQDIMRIPRMVMGTVTSISTAVASITKSGGITTIKDLLKFTKALKKILQAIREVKSQIQNTYNKVKMIYDKLASGQYLSTAIMLVGGGLRFIEIPIEFNTVYPHGNNYRTSGGHAHIEDNTPGKEQQTYMHPTGSTQNFTPDGNVVTKAKNTQQVTAGQMVELNSGDDTRVTSGKKVDIQGESIHIHDKGTGSVTINADDIIIQTDPGKGSINIGNGSINMIADPACGINVTGGTGCTISGGKGPLVLCSDTVVAINAPNIIIGGIEGPFNPQPSNVAIASTAAGVIVGSTVVNSTMWTPAGVNHAGTLINMTAGVITLN